MTKKNTLISLSILLGLLIVFGVATHFIVSQNKKAVIDETRQIFTNQPGEAPYTDLAGNPISLDQYLGKILVVSSWASWSPFSQAELNMMAELAAQYKGQEISFLAINRKETKEQTARYLQTLTAFDGVVMALDPRDYFYNAVGGYAMPELVVYNSRGEIVNHFRGSAPKSEIITTLDSLLSKTD